MCLLSYYPPGVLPAPDRLEAGAEVNSDGFGFAVWAPGGLHVEHSLSSDLVSRFREVRDMYPDGPALFHSRLITAGAPGMLNLHPFRVGGDGGGVVAHNGTLFEVPEGEQRCDTLIFAQEMLPAMLEYGTTAQIAAYVGESNKLVIIKENGVSHLIGAGRGRYQQARWSTGGHTVPALEWHSGSDFLRPGPASDSPGWARELGPLEAHLLYRQLGNKVLGLPDCPMRDEFQQLRGDLRAVTQLHTGEGATLPV